MRWLDHKHRGTSPEGSQSLCTFLGEIPSNESKSQRGNLHLHFNMAVRTMSSSYLSFLNEFRDDNRVIPRDRYCTAQVLNEINVSVRDIHCCTTQHIRGSHQAGVTNRMTELLGILQRWHEGTKSLPVCLFVCF